MVIFHRKIITFTAVKYFRVIALISANIVPSCDIEGRELASVYRYHNEGQLFTDISASILLLYSYKYL